MVDTLIWAPPEAASGTWGTGKSRGKGEREAVGREPNQAGHHCGQQSTRLEEALGPRIRLPAEGRGSWGINTPTLTPTLLVLVISEGLPAMGGKEDCTDRRRSKG